MIEQLQLLVPECILAATALGLFVAEASYRGEPRRLRSWIAVGGILTALLQVFAFRLLSGRVVQSEHLSLDGVAFLARVLLYSFSAVTAVAIATSRDIQPGRLTEAFIVLLSATLGGSLLAFSHDLIVSFTGLLGLQISVILLLAHGKKRQGATDAMSSVFGFFFFATLFFVVALAAFHQSLGTFDLSELVARNGPNVDSGQILTQTLLCFFLAAGCCLAVFPMYFWVTDAMEGAPAPIAVFLSAALPCVGMSMLLRVILALGVEAVQSAGTAVVQVLIVSATVSMLVGGLLALRQNSLRRTLGWLGVSQSGFWILSLVTLSERGVAALLFGMTLYILAAIGGVLTVSKLSDAYGTDELPSLRGAFRLNPTLSLGTLSFFLCLAAVPPFAPFLGRFATLIALFEEGRRGVALVGVLAWCLSIAAVGRIIVALAGSSAEVPRPRAHQPVLGFLAAAPLLVTGFAEPLYTWVLRSIRLILW